MILGLPKQSLSQQKPQNLSEWIEAATAGLVPSARARIHREIEAHYSETVQSHLQAGVSEPGAQAAALADLGDAQAAARRFRVEHLTTLDTNLMVLQAGLQSFIGLILIMYYGRHLFPPDSQDPTGGHLIILIGLFIALPHLFCLAISALVWWSRKVVTRRLIILLPCITWVNVGGLIMLMHSMDKTSDQVSHLLPPLELASYIMIAAMVSINCLRLRGKLESANENDPPPRSRATA